MPPTASAPAASAEDLVSSIDHIPEFGRFPSVARAAKTRVTARQGEPDSNLHPCVDAP